MRGKSLRKRALVALLHNIRSRRALVRSPLVAEAWGDAGPRLARSDPAGFVDGLPCIVESLVDELSAESAQQHRRFNVLRRTDIDRERHESVARDAGLSRSQFYRDLSEARECLMHALEDRLGAQTCAENEEAEPGGGDARFTAIDALREGGRFARAHELAIAVARDSNDAAQRVRAFCTLAELEIELGSFANARGTALQARSMVADIADDRTKSLLGATCDLVEFEAAHCQGEPAAALDRSLAIDRLRQHCQRQDRLFASLLVKALVQEASILFERDQAARAYSIIEEASSVVARNRLGDTRLAVDVAIRVSGIRALHADQVSSALDETAKIVERGNRTRDVRTLRLGMQMMSAHLLTLGRLEEARHFALEARTLIELFGSTLDRLVVLSNLARIDISRGDGTQALGWIGLARGLSCDAFSITQALAISHAEALVLIEQPERAAAMARALGDRVGEWPRLLGRAKLAEATALSALMREREARACSEEAVAFSRGTAGPLLHLRALDLNVKLTGNAGSKAALRDLQAALSA
jgi:hypothetical protein